jgi:hypothetical protein
MANPTTYFGWVMPTATDLVTDLPADFNTFGQGVDTSMQDLLGGTTGQILSKTSATNMDFTWTTPNPGDITGVTAGTGISGGGTSGDVTVTNSMATAFTTSGDLIQATGSGTFARLGTGTSGQYLTTNGTTNSWGAISAGGMTVLSSGSLSGASVTISSISGSYNNLQLIIQNALPSAQAAIVIRFNSDTGSNYVNADTSLAGSSTTYSETYNTIAADQHTSGTNLIVADIPNYANTSTRKLVKSLAINQNNGTPNFNLSSKRGSWNNTAAISSITILFYSGTISSGSYVLYGVK